jgi:Flp pilus assembly protein TadG
MRRHSIRVRDGRTPSYRRLYRDESGMTFAYVAVGLLSFLAASTLAIDVGMFMTARSQAQNAADAGALAGAVALAFDSFENRSASGPAVQSAIVTAKGNGIIGAPASVTSSDVTFPIAPDGSANRVRVAVFRTAARSNSIATLVGPVFGVPTVDINAAATAEAAPANAMTCVKPFTIPDKWVENSAGPWTTDSTFDRYDNKGKLLAKPDVYIPPGKPGYAGYDPIKDKGTPLMIRAGTGNNISPSMYWSWKMPNDIGGDFYRDNIANCNQSVFTYNDPMNPEPGAMAGPTADGIDDLIAKDPTAKWDTVNNRLMSDKNPSPRVFPIPLYDPDYYQLGKANGRDASLRMANWIGFFVESRSGNNVYGRITPILGVIDPNAGPAPAGAFPRAIRLVQ